MCIPVLMETFQYAQMFHCMQLQCVYVTEAVDTATMNC